MLPQLWYFDESSGSFKQQWSSSWHDRCLLSVKLLRHQNRIWAISGATDGRLAVWDLHGKSESPVWTLDGVHQSGANCLDAIFEGEIGSGST